MRNWLRDRFGRRKEQKETGTLPDPGLMENDKKHSPAGDAGQSEASLLPGETRRERAGEAPKEHPQHSAESRPPRAAAPRVEEAAEDEGDDGGGEGGNETEGAAAGGEESRSGRSRRRRRGRGGKGRRGDRPAGGDGAAPVREKPLQPTMDHLSGVPGAPAEEAPAEAAPERTRNRRDRGERGERRRDREREPRPAAVPAEAAEGEEPAVAGAPRKSKGVVVLSIGLPGSGKSSWFKRHNITPLSSDQLRFLLFDDETDQRLPDLVFSNLRSMLRARLVAKRPMSYVDATNLTPHDRQTWIKMAHDYGYEAHAVYFDVPLEVCLTRNQTRKRQVEDDVLQKMAAKIKAPTFEEGFTKITVVRVKRKPDEAAPEETPVGEAAETESEA